MRIILPRSVLVAVAMVSCAIQLAGCHDEDGPLQHRRKQAITAVEQAVELGAPICSLAHKEVRLGPWSFMSAKLVSGKPDTWEVTFNFWCDGDNASRASTRIKGTARALVIFDQDARIVSWSETSNSPLSLITMLIWLSMVILAVTATLCGAVGYGLYYLLGVIAELSTDLAGWCLKILLGLLIPILLVLLIVATGASGYIVFHSVPGAAVGAFLAWRIAAAFLKRIRRLRKGAPRVAKNDGRRWHRRGAVLVFLGLAAAGIYIMEITAAMSTEEITARSILGAVVGLLTCGIIGRVWGPLFMGGARHSASVGAGCGAIAGAICGAQIILPEWWILAVFVGAAFGAKMDRVESGD